MSVMDAAGLSADDQDVMSDFLNIMLDRVAADDRTKDDVRNDIGQAMLLLSRGGKDFAAYMQAMIEKFRDGDQD